MTRAEPAALFCTKLSEHRVFIHRKPGCELLGGFALYLSFNMATIAVIGATVSA